MDEEIFKQRMRWAINYVINKNHLSNVKLGEMFGVNPGTINNYRNMKTVPDITFLMDFAFKFGFNEEWLLHGEGEPFEGARPTYPDICGPETEEKTTEQVAVREQEAVYMNKAKEPDWDGFGRSVSQLREIYNSQDPVLIPAIQANLASFSRAVRSEMEMERMRKDNEELRVKMRDLEERLNAIKANVGKNHVEEE